MAASGWIDSLILIV